MNYPIKLLACLCVPLAISACEIAPKVAEQNGFRGTGMNQISLKSIANADHEVPSPPYELTISSDLTAGEVYENVQVLQDVSVDEFNYIMAAITEWVSPEQGCNYCHNPANMASDEVYTKTVARSMILMNQNVNANWTDHVEDTGVTCWTCHRGNVIPEEVWSMPDKGDLRFTERLRRGQNQPVPETAYSSLPVAAVSRYFGDTEGAEDIRVASTGLYPTDNNTTSTMETENTYSLMMHMSDSLGVNCTYCHNTQSFGSWDISPETRAKAWHGIQMVRDINSGYITPITAVFPENRLGDAGDPYKVNCTTCHQGVNKPMGGAQMAKDYPSLLSAPVGDIIAMESELDDTEG